MVAELREELIDRPGVTVMVAELREELVDHPNITLMVSEMLAGSLGRRHGLLLKSWLRTARKQPARAASDGLLLPGPLPSRVPRR